MKKIVFLIFVISFLLFVSSCSKKTEHIKKYPNGLISDTDYGILNENDLAVETLNVRCLTKFSETDNRCPYPRWQCFKTSSLRMTCEDTGFGEDYKEEMGGLIISINDENKLHEYFFRHTIPLSSCYAYKEEIEGVIRGEKYFCIVGEFIQAKDNQYSWVYDKLKTKKGCQEWFEGTCDYSSWVRSHNYKIVK